MVAFILLAAAAGAVLLGQFNESRLAPMLSVLLSTGATACSAAAVLVGRRRS